MIKVFYNPKQSAQKNESFSPSAQKPALVVDAYVKSGGVQIIESGCLRRRHFYLAHEQEYVDGVLNLTYPNGFGNRLPEIAESLPYVAGSFIDATLDAVKTNTVNFSPTSGFHHAHHSHGEGFCTFNNLIVAAEVLKERGSLYKGNVGILDLDFHAGNGSQDIIDKLGLDYIKHWSLGYELCGRSGREIIDSLEETFEDMYKNCDVVLIQLGADSCKDDPLGGCFTKEEMYQRDKEVFRLMKKYNLCGVYNTAGGYQKEFSNVIDLHLMSLKAWKETYES